MKAVVVYESLWGNTAAIARAIAEGIGSQTRALSTGEAVGEAMAGVDLVVAGAPLIGFRLPADGMRRSIERDPKHAGRPPDLASPSMRAWLAALPKGSGHAAAFETRLKWSPGSATGAIAKGLARLGYRRISQDRRFLVTGTYGPLAAGELERAKAWGAELARLAEGG